MIARQIYAGWIGVIINDECYNGLIRFNLTPSNRTQLKEYFPTTQELNALQRNLEVNFRHDKKVIDEVRKWNLSK